MAVIYRYVVFSAAILLGATFVSADPITGLTYTYDFSQADPFTGSFTAPHPEVPANDTDDASDPSAVTSKGMLIDGDFGNTVIDPPAPCCLYNNGTYAGFRNDGVGGAPQPKIDVDLGGTFDLNSFTLHYLVEDLPSIYSPQQISNSQGMEFNALTVSGSMDGENFSELGFSNDFVPVFGPEGDFGSGAAEVRIATIDLTGSTASHISIDIRTPWSWIFLSEFVVDGASVGGLDGDYNDDGKVDAADYVTWRKNQGTNNVLPNDPVGGMIGSQQYDNWRASFGMMAPGAGSGAGAVPEPASRLLIVFASLLLAANTRRRKSY